MDIIFIIFSLLLMATANAVMFRVLIGKDVGFRDCFKLTAVAAAINKFFFTGSGYLAAGYFSKHKNLSFHRAIAAFLLSEFLMVLPWIVLGVFFGVRLAVKIPFVVIAALVILAAVTWFKKDKFIRLARDISQSFKEMKNRIIFVIPFMFLHMGFFTAYYFFLFRYFSFNLTFLEIIKIIAVSYTMGYLSPAPAGVGFKETGLVLLLLDSGFALDTVLLLTILDRVIITSFWAILGCLMGFDLIKQEFKRRFGNKPKISPEADKNHENL